MIEKYLPIGTVVTLKEGTKKIMIIGYCPINDKNQMYDYSACPFPEGVINPNRIVAFNHNNIEMIYQKGIENEEYVKFNKSLNDIVKGMEEIKNVKLPEEVTPQNMK